MDQFLNVLVEDVARMGLIEVDKRQQQARVDRTVPHLLSLLAGIPSLLFAWKNTQHESMNLILLVLDNDMHLKKSFGINFTILGDFPGNS